MVAKSKEIESDEIPNENVITPDVSPERGNYGSSYPDDAYVEIEDEFIRVSMDIDSSDTEIRKKLLEKHAMNYKTAHDPEFATSPISIKEKDYDFSVDLSLISIVENEPFYGKENENGIEHMSKLTTLSRLFSDDKKRQGYYITKLFPFSLKNEGKS